MIEKEQSVLAFLNQVVVLLVGFIYIIIMTVVDFV